MEEEEDLGEPAAKREKLDNEAEKNSPLAATASPADKDSEQTPSSDKNQDNSATSTEGQQYLNLNISLFRLFAYLSCSYQKVHRKSNTT